MPVSVLSCLGYGVAAVFAVCGVAFLAFAGYLGLLEVVRPVFAALLTGAALFVLVLSSVGLARLAARRPARRRTRDPLEETLREHIDELLSAGIRRHPAGAAFGTLLLGMVAGRARSNERKQGARERSRAP